MEVDAIRELILMTPVFHKITMAIVKEMIDLSLGHWNIDLSYTAVVLALYHFLMHASWPELVICRFFGPTGMAVLAETLL